MSHHDNNHNFNFSNDLVIHDNNYWLQLWVGRYKNENNNTCINNIHQK